MKQSNSKSLRNVKILEKHDKYVGINIGAVSVNVVWKEENGTFVSKKQGHFGNPQMILNDILISNQLLNNNSTSYFEVSGTFGEISEIKAIERGIQQINQQLDAVLSLGGEAFVLYLLDKQGHIINILSQDKCAAGSGEFFLQQIERLNLSLEEAIDLAEKGKKIQIASRCSVHCKSDVTHKLNRGEASIEDILFSLISNMINKSLAMIQQSRVSIKNLLVIGGLTLNKVVVQQLHQTLSEINVIIHPFSSLFEAYGTALLAQDNPINRKPLLKIQQTFTILPSLGKYSHLVRDMQNIQKKDIQIKKDNAEIDPLQPYILGIDVGSTTTKAVLFHPDNRQILASHYGRTNGNPIEATQKCIQEIINQVGSVNVKLIGVTGSGRQMVAAYLGTSAVYNEISAHSEGAAYFDPEVDTIFEIGGQDAKYMFLANGVPVDYAMNASCSAGTGSFLEESAKCDLGVTVYDIGDVAIKSPRAVRFKADCAAFINSDIRTALQEGYSKPEIIAGLVYSIVNNYLNKVKGTRPIGKKIFLQGGVAKNRAMGNAFAQVTGREIIIPPFPELMGAFGIALIAQAKFKEGEVSAMPPNTTLDRIIATPLKHLGSFTCKSCQNYCQIERYAVGNRKFPFGGKCTRYEHIWRQTKSIQEQEDLVSYRTNLMFPDLNEKISQGIIDISSTEELQRIGLPRALLTHSLYPLFSTFFTELGFEVILSDIDPDFALIPNAPLCYPMQIFHGAVADLVKKGVHFIFTPHITKMKKFEKWYSSTFCPITQSGPYMVTQIFNHVEFLIPELDFSQGYFENDNIIRMAVEKLHVDEDVAYAAYNTAVLAQEAVEENLKEKGRTVLQNLIKSGQTGIIIVGRSYNVFPKETSQSIPKKLTSMGVQVIPFDFLEPTSESDTPWYFANYVTEAVNIVKQHDNLFLLYINNFSCTIDAFIQHWVRSQMGAKPYLLMELDAHMADAGTQTRLEAFLEIIKNYRQQNYDPITNSFRIARVEQRNGDTVIIRTSGEEINIFDPKVKIHLFPFSPYHTDLFEKMLSSYGYNVEPTGDIQLSYPVEGLKYCSGKECIPLPIVLGHILHLVRNRKPGEIIGYFMLRGGEPCVVFSYGQYIRDFLEKNHISDVFFFDFDKKSNFMGANIMSVIQYAPKILILGDIINDIHSALEVVGRPGSIDQLQVFWKELLKGFNSLSVLDGLIDKLINQITTIPIQSTPQEKPIVLLSGDFFVRFSPFFLKELKKLYNSHGIIVKSTDLFELFAYGIPFGSLVNPKNRSKYLNKVRDKFRGKDRIWKNFSAGFYASQLIYKYMEQVDHKLRKRFEKTNLLFAPPNDIIRIVRNADALINPQIYGEGILTVGKGIEVLEDQTYDGLILIGPQFCLPYRASQAILKPIYYENNFPYMVFDAEISAISPNIKRLIESNIEQIKRHFEIRHINIDDKSSAKRKFIFKILGG
ncbi:acyl-CoA dehydratase activase [Candidatus Harpocratesius sp.]